MTTRADLPRLDDLPIPEDVRADGRWSATLREMADHIGAPAVLRVAEALGGQTIYIPHDPERSPFRDLVSAEQQATLAHVYGGERFAVPLGARELAYARRAGVIAGVRAKRLTIGDAAIICKTTRSRMSFLVNKSDEGTGAAIPAAIPKRRPGDRRQIEMFDPH